MSKQNDDIKAMDVVFLPPGENELTDKDTEDKKDVFQKETNHLYKGVHFE